MKITMQDVQKIYDINAEYYKKVRENTLEKSSTSNQGLDEKWKILFQADGTAIERVFISSIATSFAQAGMSFSRFLKCLEVCGIEVVG